ncbi:MAG TPA: hypothetical protein PK954_06255, partial [Anaerolineales bacterium]|nr:hypothetical protein [Anaerolineales bacterium]
MTNASAASLRRSPGRASRMHRADETLLLRDQSAQPRQQSNKDRVARRGVEGRDALSAESQRALVALGDVARGPLDQVERQRVAGPVVLGPVDQAMLAHHKALQLRVGHGRSPHHEAQIKAGSLPGHP